MVVVIQCAATKSPYAGHLCGRDGRRVWFVASLESAPAGDGRLYADRTILRVPQVFLGALFCVNTTKTQVVTRMDSFRRGSFIRIGPIGRWQCALAWTASIFSLQDGG